MNEFWAALAGAAVGGVATLVAALLSMKHERELSRQVITAEREHAVTMAAREACTDLLHTLNIVSDTLPDFVSRRWQVAVNHGDSFDEWNYADWTQDHAERVATALEALRVGQAKVALVPSKDVQQRWERLHQFCTGMAFWTARRSGGYISRELSRRLLQEVRLYLVSVDDTIRAYLDDRPLPAERLPPDFTEEDVKKWFREQVRRK